MLDSGADSLDSGWDVFRTLVQRIPPGQQQTTICYLQTIPFTSIKLLHDARHTAHQPALIKRITYDLAANE
jgi:hypothetical protein